jgi:hypothetical protein
MTELAQILVEIKEILKALSQNFSVGKAFIAVIAFSIGFVIALALNNALVLTFDLIPVGKNGVLGAWIYAVIALIIGLVGLWLLYRYLSPKLSKMG